MSNSCTFINPDECGNMYFRSHWDFCTEYKAGEVVRHNNTAWICLKPHAGKDPNDKDNSKYWMCLGGAMMPPPPPVPFGKIILDGGDAFTETENFYGKAEVDGGSSSDRIYKPLI